MTVTMAELSTVSDYLKGKHVLITGGTGSFGSQVAETMLQYEVARLIIFSRDEKKQHDMYLKYRNVQHMRFIIGDVRNYESIHDALQGVDVVFHAAALKQVPSCQFNPMEAVRTNILGAENVRRASIANKVETVVALSTDKAVKPVNVMGMTKSVMERVFLNTPELVTTRFVCVRYGNVIGSRGSVVPLFHQLLEDGQPLSITDENMTRFLLTLPEAIDLVFFAMACGNSGSLYVRKMPACTIGQLARVMSVAVTGRDDYPREIIGVRPGEKHHEVLVSEEEMVRAIEYSDYYEIKQDASREQASSFTEYRSDNTNRLSDDELGRLLRVEGWIPADIKI
jgi:UDP-N-acetylglucosamine 4,6-dehydratase/5-epimerase